MAGTPTSVSGARLVSNINSADIVKDVSPVILMLQDDRKNLMTYLSGLDTRNVENSRFDWFEDEILPNRGTMGASAASAASSATANLDLSGRAATVYVKQDDIIHFPENGEIARVLATPTSMTAVNVARNRTGAATGTIAASSLWIKIGDAREGLSRAFDNNGNLKALTVLNSSAYNYTQTFREVFGMSRREQKTKLYSGKDEATQKAKALMQICENIEHTFWFGQRLDEGNERTLTGGVLSFMLAGNTQGISALTEQAFDDFVRRITRYGNRRKRVLFCSRFVAATISRWARQQQRIKDVGTSIKYGVHVEAYRTGGGTDIEIITADALEGLPGAQSNGVYDGYAALMDMTGKKKVIFGGDDLKYAEGIQFKDMDGKVNAYLSDVGYQPGDTRKDGLITGIQGV